MGLARVNVAQLASIKTEFRQITICRNLVLFVYMCNGSSRSYSHHVNTVQLKAHMQLPVSDCGCISRHFGCKPM